MNYRLNISCIDGSTVEIGTTDIDVAKSFFDQHDHEGSFVHVNVDADEDDAYALFNALVALSSNRLKTSLSESEDRSSNLCGAAIS